MYCMRTKTQDNCSRNRKIDPNLSLLVLCWNLPFIVLTNQSLLALLETDFDILCCCVPVYCFPKRREEKAYEHESQSFLLQSLLLSYLHKRRTDSDTACCPKLNQPSVQAHRPVFVGMCVCVRIFPRLMQFHDINRWTNWMLKMRWEAVIKLLPNERKKKII